MLGLATDLLARLAAAGLRPARHTAPLSDFGMVHRTRAPYDEVSPASVRELVELVRLAYDANIPLRLRGCGHSLSGASVPRPGELLVRTERLVGYRFEEPGTITVEPGAALWDVRDLCNARGWRLPVLNNGSSGPTVGGFVAAGGLGPDSGEFGGFWSNTRSITVVTGTGEIRTLEATDEDFRWFFGAMGVLGAVLEAKLVIVPNDPTVSAPYPMGEAGAVPKVNATSVPVYQWGNQADPLSYWVTLLVPTRVDPACVAPTYEAMVELDALRRQHARALEYLPVFRYNMSYRGLVAPLVFPFAEDFAALFLWGKGNATSEEGRLAIAALESDFIRLVRERGYHRYHQTELVGDEMDFPAYYGPEIWGRLVELKRRYDPRTVFNRGALPVGAPPASMAADSK